MGEKFIRFVHPDFVRFAQQLHRDRVKGKIVPDEYEGYLVTKWGEKVSFESRVQRVRYKGRRAFIVIMVPLEKRKRLEKERCAQQKLEAIERMSQGIVREIDHCIGIVNACMKKLGSNSEGEVHRHEELMEGIKHLKLWHGNLSESLRCLADIHSPLNDELFPVKNVIEQTVITARHQLEKEKSQRGFPIHLKAFIRTSSAIRGNLKQIKSALLFMITNAIEAMPEEGEIYLTAEEREGFVNIFLQDNGTGIKKEHEEKIFDPFFTTKGENRMGLGLSLADAIIRRHGGSVELISHESNGTTFCIKLPVAPVKTKPKRVAPGRLIRDAKILIISEQDAIHDLLCQSLVQKGGIIFESITPTHAEKILRKKDLDVIIVSMETDWANPELILHMVRKYQKGVKVVFIPSNQKDMESLSTIQKDEEFFLVEWPLEMKRAVSLISKSIGAKEVQKNAE